MREPRGTSQSIARFLSIRSVSGSSLIFSYKNEPRGRTTSSAATSSSQVTRRVTAMPMIIRTSVTPGSAAG